MTVNSANAVFTIVIKETDRLWKV